MVKNYLNRKEIMFQKQPPLVFYEKATEKSKQICGQTYWWKLPVKEFVLIKSNLQHECQTGATRVWHECNTSNTSVTRTTRQWHEWDYSKTLLRYERHKCCKSARVRHERHECTGVKNFDFENGTKGNIFSHPHISYVTNETLQGEEDFYFKNYLLEMCHCNCKMCLKNAPQ